MGGTEGRRETEIQRQTKSGDGWKEREREMSVKARAERHCRIVSNPSLGQFRRAKCVQCTHQVNTAPVVQKRYVERKKKRKSMRFSVFNHAGCVNGLGGTRAPSG